MGAASRGQDTPGQESQQSYKHLVLDAITPRLCWYSSLAFGPPRTHHFQPSGANSAFNGKPAPRTTPAPLLRLSELHADTPRSHRPRSEEHTSELQSQSNL